MRNSSGCPTFRPTASQAVNLMVSPLIRGHWKSRHTKDPKDPKAW